MKYTFAFITVCTLGLIVPLITAEEYTRLVPDSKVLTQIQPKNVKPGIVVSTDSVTGVSPDKSITEHVPPPLKSITTLKPREDSNTPKTRKARDIEFKIYDRSVIQQLIDSLKATDPKRASILQANIHRVVVKVEIDDDYNGAYTDDIGFLQFGRNLGLPLSRRRREVKPKNSHITEKSNEREAESSKSETEEEENKRQLKGRQLRRTETKKQQPVKQNEDEEQSNKEERENTETNKKAITGDQEN